MHTGEYEESRERMELLIYCEWVGQVERKNRSEEFYLQNFCIILKGVSIENELRKRHIL